MYELWEVRHVKGKWQENKLHERQYLNDVKSFAEKELNVPASEWGHNHVDSDLHYNVNLDRDHRHHYVIETHTK